MTAAATVASFSAAGLVAPEYGGRCLDSVLPAAAGALGVDLELDHGSARDAQVRLGLPDARRVCVVLVDGVGIHQLRERLGHTPFLRGRSAETSVLTAGFPSTTAVSMGLFGTGTAPGGTGLVGYSVRDPATGRLANLVSWEGAGSPQVWQPRATVFERLVAAGTPVTSVGPGRFDGSGLTAAALRGSRFVAAERLEARVDATVRALAQPGLVYLYWGEVDKVGHQRGWQSAEWADELTAFDRELARLARAVPRDTLLVVTADHGMVDVDHDELLDVARTPELAAGVEVVAGEPRASHVHALPGEAEAVARRWTGHLEGRAVVATRAEAVAAGWFGPVDDRVLPMIGDVVVAATGRAGVVDSRTQTPHSLRLVGMHGSFTPGEMHVPLVVVG